MFLYGCVFFVVCFFGYYVFRSVVFWLYRSIFRVIFFFFNLNIFEYIYIVLDYKRVSFRL